MDILKKVRISNICHERIDANCTIASRGISNESVGAKFTRNGRFPNRTLYLQNVPTGH